MMASTKFKSSGYVQKLAVADRGVVLLSLFGYHKGATTAWLQIHESVAEPSAAAVPVHTLAVGAADNFSLAIPVSGLPMSKLYIALSTDAATYVAGAADVTLLGTVLQG